MAKSKSVNLKPKSKVTWAELIDKRFVAIYIALAAVLVINQVVFSIVLKDRGSAQAFDTTTNSGYTQSITNLGNFSAAAGATDVTLAEFYLPDSIFFNKDIACNGTAGSPCTLMLDADGAGTTGAGTDDDGVEYSWQMEPDGQLYKNYFKASDGVCVNSLNNDVDPIDCIYIDKTDGTACTDGATSDSYILGSGCAAIAGTDELISGILRFSHSETINTSTDPAVSQYDYCDPIAVPGCGAAESETIWYNTGAADTRIQEGIQSASCFRGSDEPVDCDGNVSGNMGDFCDPISNGMTLTKFDPATRASERLCVGSDVNNPGTCAYQDPDADPALYPFPNNCPALDGDEVAIIGNTDCSGGTSVVVGNNWSYLDNNGTSGYQLGEDIYFNRIDTNGDPGTVFDNGTGENMRQGAAYPGWPANVGFVDLDTNGYYNDSDIPLIDNDSDGTYSAGDSDIYSKGGLTLGDEITPFNQVGDLIYINGSDDPLSGDTLYDVVAGDYVCSDNTDLALASCVYVETDGNGTLCDNNGLDTLTYYLGSGCATGAETQILTGDNWATTDDTIDASTDFIKEEGFNPLAYDLNGRSPAGYPVYYVDQNQNSDFDCGDEIYEDNGNLQDGPGSVPNGAVDFMTERINVLALKNIGSANLGTEITNIRLYADYWFVNGLGGYVSDGHCSGPGGVGDSLFTSFNPYGSNLLVSNMSNVATLYRDGHIMFRVCIVADIAPSAINGRTFQLQIPKLYDRNTNGLWNPGDEGMFFYSKNDGLTDNAYTLPYTVTINSGNFSGIGGMTSPVPNDVSDLKVSANAGGRVTLTWQDPESYYFKEVVIKETWQDQSSTVTIDKGVQTAVLEGRTPGWTYNYLVKARASDGQESQGVTQSIMIPFEGETTGGGGGAAAAPLPPEINIGNLVKNSSSSAIYYIGADKRKHLFINETVYRTWYTDFTGVKTVSSATLALVTDGKDVYMREGTYLVKKAGDPKVYAILPGGSLSWIKNENIAKSLFGSSWAKKVLEISDAMLSQYAVGSVLDSAVHPSGSLIIYAGSNAVYYIENGLKRYVSAEVWRLSRFQDKFINKNIEAAITYSDGAAMAAVTEVGYWK